MKSDEINCDMQIQSDIGDKEEVIESVDEMVDEEIKGIK